MVTRDFFVRTFSMPSAFQHRLTYRGREVVVRTTRTAVHDAVLTQVLVAGSVLAERVRTAAGIKIERQHRECVRAVMFGAFDGVISVEESKEPDSALETMHELGITSGEPDEGDCWAELVPEGPEPAWQQAETLYDPGVQARAEEVANAPVELAKDWMSCVDGESERDLIRTVGQDAPVSWTEFAGYSAQDEDEAPPAATFVKSPAPPPRSSSVQSRLDSAPTYLNPDLPGRWNWPRPKRVGEREGAQVGLLGMIRQRLAGIWTQLTR